MEKPIIDYIRIVPRVGKTIQSTAQQAIILSATHETDVKFIFNGQNYNVSWDSLCSTAMITGLT